MKYSNCIGARCTTCSLWHSLFLSSGWKLYSSHMQSAISRQQNPCACVMCACARRYNQICCGKFNALLLCSAIVHFLSCSKNLKFCSVFFFSSPRFFFFICLFVFIFIATQLATYHIHYMHIRLLAAHCQLFNLHKR